MINISLPTTGLDRLVEMGLGTLFAGPPILIHQGILCMTCGTVCGCKTCLYKCGEYNDRLAIHAEEYSCRCTKFCNSCYKDPCICKDICYDCKEYPCDCLPPPCAKCGTYPCECLLGFKSGYFKGTPVKDGRILVPVEPKDPPALTFPNLNAIANQGFNYIINGTTTTAVTGANNVIIDILPVVEENPNPPIFNNPFPPDKIRYLAVPNHQTYRPEMLNWGSEEDKKLRRISINFRNQVLGVLAKDLYSPAGLRIKSKIYPGREYVFYSHHNSVQIYDYGINVGRLDLSVPGANGSQYSNIPFGDVHLATILMLMHDEENSVVRGSFSRVRDI